MHDAGYCQIPLKRRGEVVAHAKVDPLDFEHFGQWSWQLDGRGYARRNAWFSDEKCYRSTLLHRAIAGLAPGDPRQVDHRNRDRLDCRRANLRIVTLAQNRQNLGAYAGSTSRHRGVCLKRSTGKWTAYCRVDGRTKHLGYFDTEEEAASVAAAFRAANLPYAIE